MLKSIYKITNKLNGKIYIGQSINPFNRFKQHCYNKQGSSYKSLINEAINKYGKENFLFEILELDIENYNEREKYWIKYFNCLSPNGYNLTEGGEEPPILTGQNATFTAHTDEQVKLVKELLKNTDLPLLEIAKQTGYADATAIQRINIGQIWNDPEENYPLRFLFNDDTSQKERWEKVVDLLLNTDLPQKEIATLCGIKRSAVTMINNGKNGRRWNINNIPYPIRSGRHYNNKPVETIPGETGSTITIDT